MIRMRACRHKETVKLQVLEEQSLREMSEQRDVEILKTQNQLNRARAALEAVLPRVSVLLLLLMSSCCKHLSRYPSTPANNGPPATNKAFEVLR
eukprot:785991-Rhodomonas_salina.2